ncbi:unnamed protein product [Cuscuta campestris]|uniref:Uncharacterized protein n=1 Tax=Cuscuta campestris TaxID=132261 RepID=A0A484N0H1_9ASTE|nr:unnamed protein product [Cuscuta campestris]
MRWHATHRHTNQDEMCHPCDSEAWKRFDADHPSFASEMRNVHLGGGVVVAQFFELREEATQNGLQVTDEEIWYSLVEGHNAKNRVPGVDDDELDHRCRRR